MDLVVYFLDNFMNHAYLLKLQCSQLSLLIALSQETKRWGERTVIMRKGQLTSVGGEIMPKDPPSFRILTPEQWIRFVQGDIKNFRDIDRKEDKSSGYVAALSSLASIFTGIQKIDKDGYINKITQSVFQDENKNQILDNLVSTSPVQDASFVEGLTQSIDVVGSGASDPFKRMIDYIKQSAHTVEETLGNLKYLTASNDLLVQGIITGGLVVAGVAASLVLDLSAAAMVGSLVPGIRSLGIIKKLADPGINLMMKIMKLDSNKTIDKIIAIISSRIFLRLTIIPVSLLTTIAFQHLRALEVAGKRIMDVKKTLPKDFFEGKDITPESRADQVITIAEQTIKDLNLDKEKIKERLVAEYQQPVTHIVNTKYSFERRLIELDYLHKQEKRGFWSQIPDIPAWKKDESGEWEKVPAYSLTTPEEKLEYEMLKGYETLDLDQKTVNSGGKTTDLSSTSVRTLSPEQRKQSYVWHKGIVEAELKYGESVDELVSSSPLGVKGKYDSLLKLISEGKPPAQPVNYVTKRISPELASSESDVDILGKRRLTNVAQEAQNILSMSNVRPEVEIGLLDYPRPFYYAYDWIKMFNSVKSLDSLKSSVKAEDFLRFTSKDGIINAGNRLFGSDRFIGFHETGHAIEVKAGLVNVSTNYINSRRLSSKEMLLKDDGRGLQYGDNETYIPTDFANQYTSKDYKFKNSTYATELTSTSLQNLANPSLLQNACKEDREHILYGLFVLDYKPS